MTNIENLIILLVLLCSISFADASAINPVAASLGGVHNVAPVVSVINTSLASGEADAGHAATRTSSLRSFASGFLVAETHLYGACSSYTNHSVLSSAYSCYPTSCSVPSTSSCSFMPVSQSSPSSRVTPSSREATITRPAVTLTDSNISATKSFTKTKDTSSLRNATKTLGYITTIQTFPIYSILPVVSSEYDSPQTAWSSCTSHRPSSSSKSHNVTSTSTSSHSRESVSSKNPCSSGPDQGVAAVTTTTWTTTTKCNGTTMTATVYLPAYNFSPWPSHSSIDGTIPTVSQSATSTVLIVYSNTVPARGDENGPVIASLNDDSSFASVDSTPSSTQTDVLTPSTSTPGRRTPITKSVTAAGTWTASAMPSNARSDGLKQIPDSSVNTAVVVAGLVSLAFVVW